MMIRLSLLILAGLFLASAGTGVNACDDLTAEPVTQPVPFESHIQPIFDSNCIACHSAGHPTGLDLQAGASYGLLVNVPSSQDGSWLRVDPGSLTDSLLFQKINCADPPVGDRMPPGGSLTPAQQALVRDWIEQGAGDWILRDRFESLPIKDCPECPAMIKIPAGSFTQGAPESEPESFDRERPQRTVNVPAFAMGQTAVTFHEWDACVADGGCTHEPDDNGWGRGNRPVISVTWHDAQEYVAWLSNQTGHDYRLPSESEWEYAARAGSAGRFNTGDCITTDQANFSGAFPALGCPVGISLGQTLPVGSFDPNAFGLYDTHGNTTEMVEDCWNGNYDGAPTDGSAWMTGNCLRAPARSGHWNNHGNSVRSAFRLSFFRGDRSTGVGFRVARSIPPPLPAVSRNGLIDWFNPDHGLFLDGDGRVTKWTNLADDNRSTGGSAATTRVEAVNGRRMIRFDSPADGGHLQYSSPGAQSLADGYTVFIVFRLNESIAGGNDFPRLWRGADDSHAFFLRRTTAEVEIKANPLAVGARPSHPYAAGYDIGDIAILTARLTPTSQQLYFNGVMVDSSESSIAAYAIDNSLFQIGNSVRGDIADVLVYDHSADLDDLDVTGQALAEAYGTTWPIRDCADCPGLVMIPSGSFTQGSPSSEPQSWINERPQRTVNVPAFAMGQTAVTFDQWDACVDDGGCTHEPDDEGFGRGNRPVISVSWNDAQEYVTWLSNKTGRDYRLPSESEWEYATRAGTTGRFNTGDCITTDQANFNGNVPAEGCPTGIYRAQTLPVASFAPNAFGLYDTHGNAREWVQDCSNQDYVGAPTDGSAWMTGNCTNAVFRSGDWFDVGQGMRSARRYESGRSNRGFNHGFRVVRSVEP
jgi:formylglycine-generating enzyme required for sulfatase activity